MEHSVKAPSDEDVCRLTWHLMNNQKISPEEWDSLMASFKATANRSRSATKLFDDAAMSSLIKKTFSSRKAQLFKKEWRPRFLLNHPLKPEEKIAYLSVIASLIGSNVQSVLADADLTGTQSLGPLSFPGVVVKRPAGSHSGWSLHLTTQGSGRYECVRQQFASRPGDLILLAPDAPYNYVRNQETESWIHHWIYFQPRTRLLEWINWPELGPGIFHVRLPDSEVSSFESVFLTTHDLDMASNSNDNALFLNYIEQILIRAQRFVKTAHAGFRDSRSNDAQAYILEHLRENPSVEDVARHVKLSRSQLSALFKQSTGRSLSKWTNERRMALAVQQLLHTDHSISAIADEIGFSDPLYFSRKFRKTIGIDPRGYRKKHDISLKPPIES